MPPSLQAFLILFLAGTSLRMSGLLGKQHTEWLGLFVFSVTLPATKKAAGIISKAIKSAAANAEDRSGGDVSVENLMIHTIAVDGGSIAKRWMPRSMGRANRINHRTSHLTVVVTDEK